MIAYAGIFESKDKAQTAAKNLEAGEFWTTDILVLDDEAKLDATPAATRFVEGIESRVRDALKGGHSVVSVIAPFGSGLQAITILTEAGATKTLEGSVDAPTRFFSEVIGMPLLASSNRPRTVMMSSNAKPLSQMLGMPLLATPKAGRKSSLGLPLATKNPHPLSSMLGMKEIIRPKAGRKSSFGIPLLVSDKKRR